MIKLKLNDLIEVSDNVNIEEYLYLYNYVKKIGKIHMFTKAHSDNIYSIRNILKDGYTVEETVHLTEGVSWKMIREWLMDRGIYIDLEYYPTALWDNIYDEIIKK